MANIDYLRIPMLMLLDDSLDVGAFEGLPARSADLLWVEYTEDEVRAIAAALQFAADHPDLDLLALMPELRRTNDEIRSFLAKIHASVLKAMERRPGRLAAK